MSVVPAGIRAGNEATGRVTDLRVMRNPASGQVCLEVSLAKSGRAELTILDASGRRVTTLLQSQEPAGSYRVTWSGNDQHGRQLAAELYFVRLATDSRVICRKVVLNR